jgi:thiamine kinase-like enzyme
MEHFEKIYKNLQDFISKYLSEKNYNELELTFEKMNGLSNDIYLVKIYDKTTNEMVHEVIYRQFGEISDLVDRELETSIIENLSSKGLTPKIFETDGKSYRIEEFISNSNTLERDEIKEDDIIERIIQILVSYTMISGVYNYRVKSKLFSQEYQIEIDQELSSKFNYQRISQNMFDMCMKDMYTKAKTNFEKFSHKFEKKYKKFLDKEVFAKFEKIKFYIENYNEVFSKIFPKNGFLVLCHNDVHRLNLLLTNDKEKMFILDHEYAALNQIGNDIVNYMIESNFDYTLKNYPYFQFSAEEINFDNYFEIFKNFLNKFECAHSNLFKEEENRKKFEKMKSMKYFLRLVCVISLFWLLYSVIYCEFDSFIGQKTFDYYQHALDRIFIFEKAYAKLQSLENKSVASI